MAFTVNDNNLKIAIKIFAKMKLISFNLNLKGLLIFGLCSALLLSYLFESH